MSRRRKFCTYITGDTFQAQFANAFAAGHTTNSPKAQVSFNAPPPISRALTVRPNLPVLNLLTYGQRCHYLSDITVDNGEQSVRIVTE